MVIDTELLCILLACIVLITTRKLLCDYQSHRYYGNVSVMLEEIQRKYKSKYIVYCNVWGRIKGNYREGTTDISKDITDNIINTTSMLYIIGEDRGMTESKQQYNNTIFL